MPFKSKERQREYQREWQRARKAGESMKPLARTLNPSELRTAQGMLDCLSDILSLLMKAEADLFMKSRAVAYVVSVGLRAVETAELERRIEALEQLVKGRRNVGNK